MAASPDATACLVNFAWLLSAHRDAAVRRPAEAVRLAERAVTLTARSAEALDALAAAYASDGRFDSAVKTGMEALARLDSTQASALAGDIRARVALYRRQIAFIVENH